MGFSSFSSFIELIRQKEDRFLQVRTVFDQVHQERTTVFMTWKELKQVHCARIASVCHDHLQLVPMDDPSLPLLEGHELFEMEFTLPAGCYTGQTLVSGTCSRCAQPEVHDSSVLTVKLPAYLLHEERRCQHRVLVAYDLAPTAMLKLTDQMTLQATVCDMSSGGLRVRIDGTRISGVPGVGQELFVSTDLGPSLMSLAEHVYCVHVARVPNREYIDLGLSFRHPHEELGRLVRRLELRRAARAG